MGRPFDFSSSVISRTYLRQDGLCACCGEMLLDIVEHAHHVVPNQSGDDSNPEDDWIRSELNCVILCDLCHYRAHEDGRYRAGAVAPADYFSYSHGTNNASHEEWVETLRNRAAATVWGARADWRR